MHLKLDKDFKVYVLDGAKGVATGEEGNWTMIYDQSIFVELPDRDAAKYVANFRYEIKEGQANDGPLTTGSYDSFDSVCSETMIGFKHTESKYT